MNKIAAATALALLAGSASGDILGFAFSLVATNEVTGEWGAYNVDVIGTDIDNDGNLEWNLGGPVDIMDSTTNGLVAQLSLDMIAGQPNPSSVTTSATYIADPVVGLTFNVFAPSQNTSIQVSSAVLSFSTISAATAQAQAAASVTVQDFNGNGATLWPGASGGYNAFLNNASSTFATLFPSGGPVTAPAFGINSASQDTGAFAFTGIGVSNISAAWDFTLSGGDLATGTSVFEIIPAPASASLLGLAGLAAARRRR